jgi:hypothetical protein
MSACPRANATSCSGVASASGSPKWRPPPPKLTVAHDPRRRQLGADREVAPSDDDRHLGLIAKAGAHFPIIKLRGDRP